MNNPEAKSSNPEQVTKEDNFEEIFSKLTKEELQSHLENEDKMIEEAKENAKRRIEEATEAGNFYVERSIKIKSALEKLLAGK